MPIETENGEYKKVAFCELCGCEIHLCSSPSCDEADVVYKRVKVSPLPSGEKPMAGMENPS